jgi:hypothetical protein
MQGNMNLAHSLPSYFFKAVRHLQCLNIPILQEAGWATGSVRTGVDKRKYLAITGVRTANRPACSELLYRAGLSFKLHYIDLKD